MLVHQSRIGQHDMVLGAKSDVSRSALALLRPLAATVSLLAIAGCAGSSASSPTEISSGVVELAVGECPDDMASFVEGNVQFNGATVKVGAKAWEWAKANCNYPKETAESVASSNPGSVPTSEPGSLRPTIERLPIDPALVNLGVTLDDKMMRAGPIVAVGSPSSGDGAAQRPEITFQFLPLNTDVFAVSDGVVLEVDAQPDSCDSAIAIVNKGAGKGAAWTVEYDHVRDVQVQAGAAIVSGQRLGSVGSLFGCRDESLGSVELQVKNYDKVVCPYLLMNNETAATTRAAVRDLMVRWNEIRPGTYLDAALTGAGCLTDELLP